MPRKEVAAARTRLVSCAFLIRAASKFGQNSDPHASFLRKEFLLLPKTASARAHAIIPTQTLTPRLFFPPSFAGSRSRHQLTCTRKYLSDGTVSQIFATNSSVFPENDVQVSMSKSL